MTAKRFKLIEYLPNVIQIEDNHQKLNSYKIVDLLNELHEENKELKLLLDNMSDRNNEIWLDDGRIYRLKKIFKGEWVND